ncbi:hypothetical protein EI94DRAFT_1787298 [Lactarius quietus]|nr:hypothetical protein EI94DRAFT_1787298 [Lactarius quietus]
MSARLPRRAECLRRLRDFRQLTVCDEGCHMKGGLGGWGMGVWWACPQGARGQRSRGDGMAGGMSAPRRLWSLPNNLSTIIEQPVKQNEQLFDNNNNAKRRKSSGQGIFNLDYTFSHFGHALVTLTGTSGWVDLVAQQRKCFKLVILIVTLELYIHSPIKKTVSENTKIRGIENGFFLVNVE